LEVTIELRREKPNLRSGVGYGDLGLEIFKVLV
jgi:hypothetical protein